MTTDQSSPYWLVEIWRGTRKRKGKKGQDFRRKNLRKDRTWLGRGNNNNKGEKRKKKREKEIGASISGDITICLFIYLYLNKDIIEKIEIKWNKRKNKHKKIKWK